MIILLVVTWKIYLKYMTMAILKRSACHNQSKGQKKYSELTNSSFKLSMAYLP